MLPINYPNMVFNLIESDALMVFNKANSIFNVTKEKILAEVSYKTFIIPYCPFFTFVATLQQLLTCFSVLMSSSFLNTIFDSWDPSLINSPFDFQVRKHYGICLCWLIHIISSTKFVSSWMENKKKHVMPNNFLKKKGVLCLTGA